MDYYVNLPDQLGKILRGRRRSLNLTQKEAAELVGLLPKTISALENRPESSSVDTLFKYLSALELEMRLQPREIPLITVEKSEW